VGGVVFFVEVVVGGGGGGGWGDVLLARLLPELTTEGGPSCWGGDLVSTSRPDCEVLVRGVVLVDAFGVPLSREGVEKTCTSVFTDGCCGGEWLEGVGTERGSPDRDP
jgi:hypothetical protein